MTILSRSDLTPLLSTLRYQFKNLDLIYEALCHRSYVNEQKEFNVRDNERLEFLGDAVLNLVTGHMLMKQFPDINEGDLSRMRASLVNEAQLAELAMQLSLGEYILLGKGETQTNGRQKKSILSDTIEAVIAAIYLDGGFDAAYQMIEHLFAPLIASISSPDSNFDYKSKLQEWVQNDNQDIPKYQVVQESGPDHDKTFTIQVSTIDLSVQGSGKSKKLAEQDAAKKALKILEE